MNWEAFFFVWEVAGLSLAALVVLAAIALAMEWIEKRHGSLWALAAASICVVTIGATVVGLAA